MMLAYTRVQPWIARYTPAGGAEKCAYCRFFMAQGWCARVLGPVSPRGWCRFYSREMVQHGGSTVIAGSAPPSLDLNFLTTTLDPSITWTRASTATDGLYTDAAGSGFNSFATNVPRINATTGLLTENNRTNFLLNSAAPATQTTASLSATSYTLWVIGTGTATVTAGTAVGTGFGTASAGAPNTFSITSAGTVTVTVAGSLTRFQLENAGYANSYIPTTGATASRQIDSGTLPTGAWYNAAAGTLCVDFMQNHLSPLSVDLPGFYTDVNNNLTARIANANVSCVAFISNASAGQINFPGSMNVNVVNKVAYAYVASGNTLTGSLNGGTVVSNTLTGLPAVSAIKFGLLRSSGQDGFVRRLRYWPRALSSAELQSVTT